MSKVTKILRLLLFATAFTPLVVVTFAPFPFIFGKMVFVRSIGGAIALLGSIWILFNIRKIKLQTVLRSFRNPVIIALAIFILSAVVSVIFAPSSYRGFFGEVDRGEGLYTLLSLFVIFLAAFLIFDRRHWQRYFQLGLLVGAFVIVHVLFRYLGLEFLPVTLGTTRQPGSFLGNPAFVASFIILLLAYAAFVYQDSRGFWKYFSLITGIVGIIVLGLLGVRGALVGVAAGIIVFAIGWSIRAKKPLFRWVPIVIIVALLLLGVLARLTPGSLWDGVPVFDRVSDFTFQSPSVQSRLISWGISWEAFKERPIFGWGPDNYSIAYNKHYNPRYAVYSEEFFDRAHNKILDVLTMQGIGRLLSYLALFFAFFYILLKTKELGRVWLLLGSVVVAYFVQNLFTFDHISSYLLFFAVLFFSAYLYSKEKPLVRETSLPPQGNSFFVQGIATILVVFSGYSLVVWNLIPLVQAKNRTTTPYNFFQKELRIQLANAELLEEVVSREPYDLRLKIRLAEIYNQAGGGKSALKRSIELIEDAEQLSPRRQAIRGVKALLLSGAGKHEEAIKLARETVVFEPRAPKSHYYLGMVLAISSGDKEEAVKELGFALNYARELAAQGDFVFFFQSDFQNMLTVYRNLGAYPEMLEAYKVAERFSPLNLNFHREGLVAAREARDGSEMIRIAEKIKDLEFSLRDEMDVIIDLAKKNKWEILDDL